MMICLILLHDIVVVDLDSHKCRVVKLDKQQPSLYLAIPQKMRFFCLIFENFEDQVSPAVRYLRSILRTWYLVLAPKGQISQYSSRQRFFTQ